MRMQNHASFSVLQCLSLWLAIFQPTTANILHRALSGQDTLQNNDILNDQNRIPSLDRSSQTDNIRVLSSQNIVSQTITSGRVLLSQMDSRKHTEEMIKKEYHRMGGYVDRSRDEKENLTIENYFTESIISMDCEEHVRFMQLNFTCIQELNESMFMPRDKQMYVVESNFQKYFLRLHDSTQRYELALEKSLKLNGVIINLLQHKVIRGRFAGIYRYEENDGLLDYNIRMDKLSLFDKLNLMLRVSKSLRKILMYRDPKNRFLNINLIPTNILLTKEHKYSFKFISALPLMLREILYSTAPEDSIKKLFVDKKSQHVFCLGKLFYFMIFKSLPVTNVERFVRELDLFIERYKQTAGIGFFSKDKKRKESVLKVFENPENMYKYKEKGHKLIENSREQGLIEIFSNQDEHKEDEQTEFENTIISTVDVRLISMIRMMLNSNPVDRPNIQTIIGLLEELKNQNHFFWQRMESRISHFYTKMKVELKMEEFYFRSTSLKSNAQRSNELEKTMMKEFKNLPPMTEEDMHLMNTGRVKTLQETSVEEPKRITSFNKPGIREILDSLDFTLGVWNYQDKIKTF